MKRSPIIRRTPLKGGFGSLKREHRLRHRSPTKAADDRKYACAKAEHFKAHPQCQYPGGCSRSILRGDKLDLHHRAGRRGPLLYCKKYFATACRPHHELAKDDPIKSRAIGWIVDVSSDEVRALKQAEILNLP